jgi:hypothetical protein
MFPNIKKNYITVDKFRQAMPLLIKKGIKSKCRVLTLHKVDETGAQFEYSLLPQMPCTGEWGLKFYVSSSLCFQKRASTHECEHFIEMQGMCAQQPRPLLALAVTWVGFVGLRAADPNTHGKCYWEELVSLRLH